MKDAWVTKPHDDVLDKEALHVIKEMPKWKPATLKGEKVNCRMSISVVFKENSSDAPES